jgi:penicillin G amidase
MTGQSTQRNHNPSSGYVMTANENNIPADHPAAANGIGYERAGARIRRVHQERLSSIICLPTS